MGCCSLFTWAVSRVVTLVYLVFHTNYCLYRGLLYSGLLYLYYGGVGVVARACVSCGCVCFVRGWYGERPAVALLSYTFYRVVSLGPAVREGSRAFRVGRWCSVGAFRCPNLVPLAWENRDHMVVRVQGPPYIRVSVFAFTLQSSFNLWSVSPHFTLLSSTFAYHLY